MLNDPTVRDSTDANGPTVQRVLLAGEEQHFTRLAADVSDGHVPAAPLGKRETGADSLVTYGWLCPGTWSQAHEGLRYEMVRTQLTLSHEPREGPAEPPPEVEVLERFDDQARWLFDRCAGMWGAAVVRDAAYLNGRFIDLPEPRYRCLGVRDGEGMLRGYAVVRLAPHRRVGADGHGFPIGQAPTRGRSMRAAYLVDWLVPPDEPEVGELLIQGVAAHARAQRAQTMLAALPEWSPWFARLQADGWLAEPSDRIVAVRSRAPRYDMHWLRDHWWYQWAESHLI